MSRRLALILIALTGIGSLAGVVAAGPAQAASATTPSFSLSNAESNSAAATQTTTTEATGSSTSSSGGGLSGTDGIVIGAIVAVVLLGIAVFVMRDARKYGRNTADLDEDPFASKRKGSKAPPKSRKLTAAERKRRKRGRAPRRV